MKKSQNNLYDKKFLIITSREWPVGFFSLFFQVLGQIYLCEKENVIPVVYFRNNCLFWEDKGRNGSRNPWEYYFYPIPEYSVYDLLDIPPSYLESCKLSEFSNSEIEPHTRKAESCSEEKYKKIKLPPNVKISNVYPEVIPAHHDNKVRTR